MQFVRLKEINSKEKDIKMSKWITFFTFLLLMFSQLSCGNPTVEDFGTGGNGGEVGGAPPQQPGPPDDDDDNPGPPDPPDARKIIVEVDGYGIRKGDLNGLKLPYKKKTVKVVPMGKTNKSKDCPKKHRHHCVKNRQVLVAFDLAEVTQHLDKFYVSDIQLMGDFYSIGKNYRTELICLLHKKACSGRGIVKLPGWGLPWIVKMAWWEKKFWKAGYENVVKTQNFHHILEESFNKDEGLYMLEGANLKFNRLFGYNKDDMTSMTKGQTRFVLAITDDTYVQNMKLRFKLVEDL